MNFTSIIKGLGKGLETILTVVQPATTAALPYVTLLSPSAGAIMGKVGTIVSGIETMVSAEKQGELKKQTAAQIAAAEIPHLESVISQFGPNVVVPREELSAVIDASVAHYSAIAMLISALQKQAAVNLGGQAPAAPNQITTSFGEVK
jgi:hypothetical protein